MEERFFTSNGEVKSQVFSRLIRVGVYLLNGPAFHDAKDQYDLIKVSVIVIYCYKRPYHY